MVKLIKFVEEEIFLVVKERGIEGLYRRWGRRELNKMEGVTSHMPCHGGTRGGWGAKWEVKSKAMGGRGANFVMSGRAGVSE